jgi:Zn-dependent protease
VNLLRDIDIGTIIIQYVVLLFSLSIHEASHAWMADRCGDYTARYLGRVTLNPLPHIDIVGTVIFPLLQFFTNLPLIGWAKPVPVNPIHLKNIQRDQAFISLAGPTSNLIAAIASFIILVALIFISPKLAFFIGGTAERYSVLPIGSIFAPLIGLLFFLFIINIALAIFNILPIPPLDGHWILYAVLPEKAASVLDKMGSYGFIILYALLFLKGFRFLFMPIVWMSDLLIELCKYKLGILS